MLDVARFHSMDSIYLTCDKENVTSYRTIENLGAELVKICNVPREYFGWYEGMAKQWIYKLDFETYDFRELI